MVKVSILGWGPRVSATTQSEDRLHGGRGGGSQSWGQWSPPVASVTSVGGHRDSVVVLLESWGRSQGEKGSVVTASRLWTQYK